MEFDEKELDSINKNGYFIFTHKHSDHYSKKNLKKVTNRENKKIYGVSNITELEKLGETIEDFNIKAYKTKHVIFGIPFRHYSYLITWHGKKIFISGDTTEPETIGAIQNIDLAFAPYWIIKYARLNNIKIDAKMIALYHLYPSQIQSAMEVFVNDQKIKPMAKQGEIIILKL